MLSLATGQAPVWVAWRRSMLALSTCMLTAFELADNMRLADKLSSAD